jgi:hypothetical protein
MQACGEINASAGREIPVFGIVTNGSSWQFYRRDLTGEVWETSMYSVAHPQEILGILDYIFFLCQQNLSGAA